MIRLTHFVAIDMKTRLFITDIRKISFDRVGELSPERAERVQRCRRADDKLRCIAGGLFMNKFLGGAKITVNEFGKPECDNGLCFNISHSGSYVLFALSDSEVGCDIEEIRFLKGIRLGKIVFCDNEMKLLGNAFDRLGTFFELWTKKEALLKCMGDGFHRGAKSVDVDVYKRQELEEVKYTGNEGLFMHIWMNLLDNAIKFSPAKGTIMMFLKQEKDSVMFILEDEGPGIEDDVKTRIFDKFYQADGSHKAEGNGLGLALVKRIVDSAGGTIKAENREYGGCRFVVELPIQKDEAI